MTTHLWVFPWLAMLCGVAALLVGIVRARPPLRPSKPDSGFAGRLVVWLIGMAVLFWSALQIGAKAGIDVIPARGVLLGALAGAVLAIVTSGKTPESPWARPLATVGGATAFLSIGLLWLTHGEVSGLTAVAASAMLTVLCFRLSAAGDPDGAAMAGALYLATLSAAVQLGYSRAATVSDAYWPYVPLLISAAVCLGLLVASAIGRAIPSAVAAIVVVGAGAWALNKTLVHDITVVKVVALGLVSLAIVAATARGTVRGRSSTLPLLVGLVAVVLAYTYWAGYGVALMALAGWSVAIALGPTRNPSDSDTGGLGRSPATAVLAFALVEMLQRLVSLQSSDSVSAVDPTDTWSLLALGFGAFLPQIAGRWIASGAAKGSTPLLFLGVALLIGAPPLIAFLFATHAAAQLLLGIGLGILVSASGADPPPVRRSVLASGVFAGLLLLLLMPLSASWKEPTRRLRLEALAGLAVAAVAVRLLDRSETAPDAEEA